MKKSKVVALDLGQRSIKGVVLKKQKGRIFLSDAFVHDFSMTNPEFPNNTDVIKNLKTITDVQNVPDYDVIFNIGSHNLASFDIQLPEMPKKELDEVILGEVQKHINYAIEKCSYDYLITEKVGDENPLFKIKVYTTKKNKVELQMKMLKEANLRPYILDADIEAQIRVLKFNDYLKDDHLHVITDIGETHTTIALTMGQKLIVVNQVDQSMGLINHKLTKDFQLDYNNGEELKKRFSLKGAHDAPDISKEQKGANDAYIELLSRIQESIDYLSEFHFKKWPVASLYFVGGGSACPGLCEIFEEHYKIPCAIPNPFRKIEVEQSSNVNKSIIFDHHYLMPLSVGLALRGVA